jgi:hypothetical protein
MKPFNQSIMHLEYEFLYRVTLKPPVELAAGYYGKRIYWEIESGEVRGDRLVGSLVGGSDWMLDTSDRFWRPFVRTQILTNDGAYIGLHYDGLVEKSDAFLRAIETSSTTNFEDHYFRIRPILESGHLKYQWLNTTFFVGEGRISAPSTCEYRVFRIT